MRVNNKSIKIGEYSLDSKNDEIIELNNLLYDEICNYIISGYSFKKKQIIAITNRRIIFLHKRSKGLIEMQDIYIDDIKGLKFERGLTSGKIKISLYDDDIIIENISKKLIEDAVQFINQLKINEIIKEDNCSYTDAKIILENNYRNFDNLNIKQGEKEKIQLKKRIESDKLKALSEQAIQKNQEEKYESERVSQLKRDRVSYCPKCHSTSLTYQNKKLSLGRAVTGGVLFGGAGAVLGGLSSKKGYIKCLSCGHKWKL